MTRRFITVLVVGAAIAAGSAGTAAASDSFGQQVATCAQMHLGQRDNPPTATCTHDGMTMTFPNFGAMVEHMRAMQG